MPITPWPSIRTYTGEHLDRVAMPLGGIGTGTVSLGGRGDLRDWEIMNRPAKGFVPRGQGAPLAACWWGGDEPGARLLEGPLPLSGYEGARGCPLPNQGLPRFADAEFRAAYPLAQVRFLDEGLPVAARLEAMNPLVPGDAEASGLPLALLRYVITNRGDAPLPVSACVSLPNFVGDDGSRGPCGGAGHREPAGNRNRFRREEGLAGLVLDGGGIDPADPAWGTIALTLPEGAGEITRRLRWTSGRWNRGLLDFWRDFSGDGRLGPREGDDVPPMPCASLAVRRDLAPGECAEFPFLLTWHFPNRRGWEDDGSVVGNRYAVRFADAWDAAVAGHRDLPALEARTVAFVESFCAGDLPAAMKEAALFNLSTLRSQTCFRDAAGFLHGWEGCDDGRGCCPGSCTHVWNYETATAALFPALARGMREVEFLRCTDAEGRMNFRSRLPLERNDDLVPDTRLAAADGQLGCIVKACREWRGGGGDDWLRTLWPAVKRALAFCWIPGGWDADRDGVMEGCQHNTMDVEYFGPNPQVQSWYLAALRAAAVMAAHLGEETFAADCRALAEAGARFMDTELFNGAWYEQHVRPMDPAAIAPGLGIGMTDCDPRAPELQLGAGCLIDQLVGEYLAQLIGLGGLLDPDHVRTTLRSILRHNRQSGFHDHFNPLRGYALGDEEALLMASYPEGKLPERPFPYFGEVMTGFEYVVATQLLQEGEHEEAERVVHAIRDRYDGQKRNPFDEAECGHHYARAMASWSLVEAWSGFAYDPPTRRVTVANTEGRSFWLADGCWGLVGRRRVATGLEVTLGVRAGSIRVEAVAADGYGEWRGPGLPTEAGGSLAVVLPVV